MQPPAVCDKVFKKQTDFKQDKVLKVAFPVL